MLLHVLIAGLLAQFSSSTPQDDRPQFGTCQLGGPGAGVTYSQGTTGNTFDPNFLLNDTPQPW
jgi:hypothetical protein